MSSSTTPASSVGMPGSKKFRHAILKNLILGLRKGGAASSSRGMGMGFHERRGAIRRAADAALATARGAAPRWSRSLAAELIVSQGDRLPPPSSSASASSSSSECKPPSNKMSCCAKRWRRLRARPKSGATAKALARVMVRKRARALRAIVPGGRGMMDECTLLGETLDYAVSLKAQVEAMQLLLRTLQGPKNPSVPKHL